MAHPGRERLVRRAYDEHGAELYRFALRWTGDRGAAEDLVQEVVTRAWQAGDDHDPSRSSLRTWLFAIARNVAIDQGRRRRVRPALVRDEAAVDTAPVADHVDDVIRADTIARALRRLSDDHRTALVETYLRDRSYDDVARELGVSTSTLRGRVFHALRALRRAHDDTSTRQEVRP